MASGEPPDDAAVFDFLDEFLRDLERGTRQPLTHYLARYRGHEEAIAGEYFAELARAGLLGAQKPGAAANNGAGIQEDPERVGPYRLLRELGRGGQGAVWLAEDTRISRQVALKLLPAEFAALSQERRRRLQREAEVIARLDHPCLCAVLDARIDGDRPYIAMRYVEGATLGEWIARAREAREAERAGSPRSASTRVQGPLCMAPRTPLELAGLLMFFERAARALHAAHEVGVMHRDVKPQNVMVARSGDPVVLDFGQARDETSDSFELTRSGDVLGTPAYMSPEQILGQRAGVDRRTDVWSLGASLFEALTLRRAFEAESVPALFMAIRGASLPDPRTLNPALPGDLCLVVATALEKDPQLRYRTALDLAEDLRRVREYEPVRARPPSAWRVFRGWFQRHPAIAYSTLGSILALSVGLASSLHLLSEKNRALSDKEKALIGKDREMAEKNRALEHAVGLWLGQRTDALIEEDPALALAQGIEAVERVPAYQTRAALFRALQACHLRSVINGSPAYRALDCCVSPDGRSIAVALDKGELDERGAGFKGGVRICDLESGRTRVELSAHPCEAQAVSFSPDGSHLAFASADNVARLAESHSGSIVDEFAMQGGQARSVEFFEGGGLVLALSDGGAIAFDARERKTRWSWRFPEGASPDREARLAVHAASARALVWTIDKRAPYSSRAWLIDVTSGSILRELALPGGFVSGEFRGDGTSFATGSADGSVRLWRSNDGTLERSFEKLGSGGAVLLARFSPDGMRLVTLLSEGEDSQAWLLYPASGAATPVGNPGMRVVHAAFSPDGRRLATAGSDMIVRLWNENGSQAEESFRGLFAPREIHWSPDGRRLVTSTYGPDVQVWYAGARPDVFALRENGSPLTCALFHPDGERVLTASLDGFARVWATPSNAAAGGDALAHEPGTLLFRLRHRGAVNDAAFTVDGQRIVTVSHDGTARIWSAGDGGELGLLLEGQGELAKLACSPDGAHVAILTRDQDGELRSGRVFLCDPHGKLPPRELKSNSQVTAMAWLPAGARLVTGHADNVLRTFDAASGVKIDERTWDPPTAESKPGVVAVAVRKDGTQIALLCADKLARFFTPGEEAIPRKAITMFRSQSIEYDATGTRLLVTGNVGRVALRLLNIAADPWSTIGQKVIHAGDMTGGAFSPDGNWVITTAKEGGAYVRAASDGSPFAHFPGPGGACRAGAISPGQGPRRALVVFDDGSVWIWPLEPLQAARARQPRPLTELEVRREQLLAKPLEYVPHHPATR